MKRQIKILAAIALMAILPLGSLFAQQPQQKGEGKFPGGRHKMLQALNLSQDQKDQIAKLKLDNQRKMVDYKSDIAKTRLDMKELFVNKNPDENKILDLSKKVSDIQAEMKASKIKTWFQIYNLLNDQQKETFRKMAPMLGERMGKGFRGGHRGMGMHRGMEPGGEG